MKRYYTVKLIGTEDDTYVTMPLSEDQVLLLRTLGNLSAKERPKYGPFLEIKEA